MILYVPKIEELDYRKHLLADKPTMSYNHAYGGTIDFNESKWQDWYERWMNDATRFYAYIKIQDYYVGEVAYHLEGDKVLCDVLIEAQYRRLGYGKQALSLLEEVAKNNKIKELYDHIAIDNPGIQLFEQAGFIVVYQNEEYIEVMKKLED